MTVRHGSGTQPAQYIRLTTAQALAAGILPAVSGQADSGAAVSLGGQQQLHLAGNKIQLVRVVTPGSSTSTGSASGAGNTAPTVVVATSSANTVKVNLCFLLNAANRFIFRSYSILHMTVNGRINLIRLLKSLFPHRSPWA